MTHGVSLLREDALSYVGMQVMLLGAMMFSIGLLLGTQMTGEAAWSYIVSQSEAPIGATPVPEFLHRASAINLWAVAISGLSMVGLIYLDYRGESDG